MKQKEKYELIIDNYYLIKFNDILYIGKYTVEPSAWGRIESYFKLIEFENNYSDIKYNMCKINDVEIVRFLGHYFSKNKFDKLKIEYAELFI